MDEAAGKQDDWVLNITAGVHKGAMTPLHATEMLVVGADDDCDLILADSGVAAHHCVLKYCDSKLFLRAMDGPLIVNGVHHEPGETVWIPSDSKVVVGTAMLRVCSKPAAVGPRMSRPSFPGHPEVDLFCAEPVTLFGLLRHSRWGIALCIAVLAGLIFTAHAITDLVTSEPVSIAVR
jgi:hypothetical protein